VLSEGGDQQLSLVALAAPGSGGGRETAGRL